jgi:hypothetical protein
MSAYVDSTDRSRADFIMFAFSFLAFMLLAAGVVVTRPGLAILGFVLLLISVLSYALSPSEGY